MASRRRSSRKGAQAKVAPTHSAQLASEDERDNESESASNRAEEDRCPACQANGESSITSREDWVRCDSCKTWYHWRCAGDGELEAVDKWFCNKCREEDPTRQITFRPPTRKSSRKRPARDYASLHAGVRSTLNRWLDMMDGKQIKEASFPTMKGHELSLEWVNTSDSALSEPVIIEEPDGLGMEMPHDDLTVSDIADLVGRDTPVEVMDVSTQSNIGGYDLARWANYYEQEPSARDKIRNVISLEISHTTLADKIVPPLIVRELDWVEKYWPPQKKGKGHPYPKVQLYCLMGVAQAWTDWHIDFAGSSVYYHIFKGSKTFYFIRPTPSNLAAYERWSGTELQNSTWLGDMVDDVYKVELKEKNTMIIPSGWIHAVYTPVDSIVFGGNFLHSYNVDTQLKVRDIEISTHVPKKFSFPYFTKLCWYVAEKFLRDLKAKEEFPRRVLESIEALSGFLMSEVHALERGPEQVRRDAKEHIPSDRVKDGQTVARELRWRIRLLLHGSSDDECEKRTRSNGSGARTRRKRSAERTPLEDTNIETIVPVVQLKPKVWQGYVHDPPQLETKQLKATKPPFDDEHWIEVWVRPEDQPQTENPEGQDVVVKQKKEVIVKVRRTENGIERQVVERLLEHWEWPTSPDSFKLEE